MEPLASKIRPNTLNEFIGQEHLVGNNKPIRVAIENKHAFSFVLWGPPGVGKTTLARIYARSLNANYYELSAVSAGKDDIRKIIDSENIEKGPKILFLDEIHRFNKSQQDFLLPHIENGKLILIGATTENPNFERISALLSRCRIFIMKKIEDKEIKEIIKRTNYKIKKDEIDFILSMSQGDARQTISILENTISLYKKINIENLKNTIQSRFINHYKKGENHYNLISAFIKSMRASQPDPALYYLSRMIKAGEDPKFIARRMIIFASEDIGIAQPTALVVANEIFKAVETIGYPECEINLAHGAVYLSLAKKDRSIYNAFKMAQDDILKYGELSIPFNIRNASTKLLEDIGYGKGYDKYTKESLMPDKLKKTKYLKRRE